VYINFVPEPIKSTFKYYYRVTLISEAYKRIKELKPSLLQIKNGDESALQFEVSDLQPDEKSNDIILTSAQQIDIANQDLSDELRLAALPTLKVVRNRVIDNLRTQKSPNKWLVSLAADIYKYPNTKKEYVPEYGGEYPLLPAQRDGVEKGAGSTDYTLVLGPPGTGKTTVILSWAKYFVEQGLKVLVTSQNNKAVDNVLERLAEDKDLECIRVGNESKVSASIHNLLIDNYAVTLQKKIFKNIESSIKNIKENQKYLKSIINYLEYKENLKLLTGKDIFIESTEQKNLFLDSYEKIIAKEYKASNAYSYQLVEIDNKIDIYNEKSFIMKVVTYFSSILNENKKKKLNKLLEKSTQDIENYNKIQKIIQNGPEFPKYTLCNLINTNLYEKFDKDKKFNSDIIEKAKLDIEYYGSIIKTIEELKSNINNRQSSLYETFLEYVDVVGATCIGINSNKKFQNIPFDVVIVDESGQIQLHNLMVPLSRASKAILVGDHKQLPPIVDDQLLSEIEEQGYDASFLEKSWFEKLWETTPQDHKTMLDTQFRCPSIISDFVSDAFYDSKYYAGPGMEKKKPILDSFKSSMVFIDTSKVKSNEETSRRIDNRTEVLGNKIETEIIISTLQNMIKELPELADNNEIGVIVPYANHVQEVKKEIKRRKIDIGALSLNDLIASVDSYQGQERDVVIFAFSRSNKRGQVGFLSDWRRLNVAVTRTKKQLIMIGNMNTLTKETRNPNDTEFKNSMKMLKNILEKNSSLLDANYILRKKNES